MTSPVPVLVAVAHGTSSAAGRSAIGSLVAAVAARRPDLTVRAAFGAWAVDAASGVELSPAAGREWANLELGQVPVVLRFGVGRTF